MSKNYYDTLEIPRTATHELIAGAYILIKSIKSCRFTVSIIFGWLSEFIRKKPVGSFAIKICNKINMESINKNIANKKWYVLPISDVLKFFDVKNWVIDY